VKNQAIAVFKQIPGHLAKSRIAGPSAPNVLPAIELPQGNEEARRAAALKKDLTDKIKTAPAAASRLVQGWMHEPKTK
jgi:hypothetical protein